MPYPGIARPLAPKEWRCRRCRRSWWLVLEKFPPSHKQTYRSGSLEPSAELQKDTHSRVADLPVSDELLRELSASIRFPSGCVLSIDVRADTAIGCCSRVARLLRVWSSLWMVALRGNERCAGYLRSIVYWRGSPLFGDRVGSQRGRVSPVGACD